MASSSTPFDESFLLDEASKAFFEAEEQLHNEHHHATTTATNKVSVQQQASTNNATSSRTHTTASSLSSSSLSSSSAFPSQPLVGAGGGGARGGSGTTTTSSSTTTTTTTTTTPNEADDILNSIEIPNSEEAQERIGKHGLEEGGEDREGMYQQQEGEQEEEDEDGDNEEEEEEEVPLPLHDEEESGTTTAKMHHQRPLQQAREDADGANLSEDMRKPDLAVACKEEGNRHFSSGQYETAIACYTEAIRNAPRSITITTTTSSGVSSGYEEKRAVFYSNRAACYVALGNYEDAVYDCDRALELKPEYVKAVARRALALEKMTQLDDALKDYQAWAMLDPSDRKAKNEVSRLEAELKKRDDKLKDEMLGKLKDLGNSLLGKFGLSIDNFKAIQDPNTGSYSISFQK